ncbi:MAG: hypothetical protein K0S66_998 [Sphingomonas sp.]|nr:hypothetical protein [Sphingomonas sp.]
MAALYHHCACAAAPIRCQRGAKPLGQCFHPLARIAFARDLQDHVVADPHAATRRLGQVEPVDQQVGPALFPADTVRDLGHRLIPVAALQQGDLPLVRLALHRAAKIADNPAFRRHLGTGQQLHGRSRSRMARDSDEDPVCHAQVAWSPRHIAGTTTRVSPASPSASRCRPCGWRSPTHCRTS